MAVAKEEKRSWMRRPGVIAAFNAIIFLHYGLLWVAAAGYVAMVVGRRASGVVEGPPVLSYSVIRYSFTYGFSLCPAALWIIACRRMWFVPKDKGIKDPLTHVVIGGLVLVAFVFLIAAVDFVVGQSPLKGSQSTGGSFLRELGPLGLAVTQYFMFIPLTAPGSGA